MMPELFRNSSLPGPMGNAIVPFGADIMRTVTTEQRVIASPVHRIGKTWTRSVADETQTLAPGVSHLSAEAVSLSHRELSLHRVVIVTARVRCAELWIRHNKIFGISVLPQHLAIDAGRDSQVAVVCV